MTERRRRDGGDLFAVNNHNEVRPRIAGGVMFDTPTDAPPVARSRGRGKSVAASRSPTAKPLNKGARKKQPSLARQMLDHISPKGTPTRD